MSEYNPSGASEAQNEVRVAIVGVGNCASSLVQGVQYYYDADENSDRARPDARDVRPVPRPRR